LRAGGDIEDAQRVTDVMIRAATMDDAPRLASLKVVWANRGPAAPDDLAQFTSDLGSWMQARGDSLLARVAEHGDDLVGMAWLVIFDRVPDLADRHRVAADVQSVFVLPAFGHLGVGRRLVSSLLDAADQRQIPRITVSSNAAAHPLYRGVGFESVPGLLERRLDPDRAR
jgi:GNAT superfamily N-acetyltransferase